MDDGRHSPESPMRAVLDIDQGRQRAAYQALEGVQQVSYPLGRQTYTVGSAVRLHRRLDRPRGRWPLQRRQRDRGRIPGSVEESTQCTKRREGVKVRPRGGFCFGRQTMRGSRSARAVFGAHQNFHQGFRDDWAGADGGGGALCAAAPNICAPAWRRAWASAGEIGQQGV